MVKSQYVNELRTKKVCTRWNFLFNLIGAVGSSETTGYPLSTPMDKVILEELTVVQLFKNA